MTDKAFAFKIEIDFDLDAFEGQVDEMRKFQRTLEDITETVFNGKIHNLKTSLKEAKPIE